MKNAKYRGVHVKHLQMYRFTGKKTFNLITQCQYIKSTY